MSRLDDLLDEEFKQAQVVQGRPGQPSDVPIPRTLDELLDQESQNEAYRPYAGESRAANLAFQGLTFGLGPRILAAAETGAVSGPKYEQARNRRWARNDAYAYDNPGSALAAEMAGAIPTAFVPGLGAGRLAQATTAGGNIARDLSMGQRVLRTLGVGRNVGSVGHEAGVLGGKMTGLYGAGASREEDPIGRLATGAAVAPIGYAFGRGTNALFGPAVGVAEQGVAAYQTGGNADRGARVGLRRALGRDGVSIADIRRELLPDMGARTTSDDAIEAAMSAFSRDLPNDGLDEMRAAYQGALQRDGISLADSTVNSHVARIRKLVDNADTTVPLNLQEMARRAGSRGTNTAWTQRVAANTPGESRERLFDTITGRQEGIIDAARNFVDRRIGGADLEGTLDSIVARNRQNSNAFYGFAKANEKPIDLRSLYDDKIRAVAPTLRGENRAVYEKALDFVRNASDAAPNGQRHTLETFILANSELNDLINASFINRNGRDVATTITGPLIELKKLAQQAVTKSNPDWRVANDITAGGKGVVGLLEDIAKIPAQSLLSGRGPRARRMIKRISSIRDSFSRLSTKTGEMKKGLSDEDQIRWSLWRDQSEAVDTGIARALHDVLDGMGDTHDLSKFFLKGGRGSSGPKVNLRTLLGKSRADEFEDFVSRSQMASTNFKNQFNSQTTPLREAADELNAEGRVAGFFNVLGSLAQPREAFRELALMASRRFNEARNARLADYYSTLTDDPAAFLRMLRQLEDDDVMRSPVFSGERMNAYMAPGVVGGAFGVPYASGSESFYNSYRPRE